MSNFTPGPWFASPPFEDEFGFQYCTVGPFDVSDRPDPNHLEDTIADVRGVNHDAIANARLIAAAPDLLAAVRHLFVCDVAGSSVDFRCEGCEAARSALATVDGLAPARGSAPS